MEWLANTQKKLQRLTYFVSAVSMFTLIPIMLLTSFDAVSRTIFGKPVPGVMEASSYMLVMMILLGLAYTQQVKGHPRVTILASRLHPRLSIFVEIVVNLLCLGITGIIVYQGWVVARSDVGKIVSDVLRIPQYPFRMLVPLGGGLLFLEFLVDLLATVQKHRKRVSKK
ncbi:MAG: TRAP transporter small permease [Firmicutes bacterium]|nr:TRAP transporter small permease [Bacillota bacterium]